MHRQTEQVISESHATSTVASDSLNAVNSYGYDAFLSIAFDTVSPLVVASTSWDDSTDTITSAAHGLYTGMVFQVTTSGGLPAGITGSTDYWVIKLTDDTFQLASSLANAVAGTEVDFTTAGTGDHTLTQQTSSATAVIQTSPDGSNWYSYDQMSAVDISALTSWSKHFETAAQFVRVLVSITKGSATLAAWVSLKG